MATNRAQFYKGILVPTITPFDQSGNIDLKGAEKVFNFLWDHHCIPFALGTTGEVNSLSKGHRLEMVKSLIATRKQRKPLIAGAGELPFRDTIHCANTYFELGLDAIVLTMPSYYKLTDQQVYDYFCEISKNIEGDLILYNIPTVIHDSIPLDVIEELSKIENIVAIKDSENDETRLKRSLQRWGGREDFVHLVGSNALMANGLLNGAVGVVPSAGNIAPQIYSQVIELAQNGEAEALKRIQRLTDELSSIYNQGFTLGQGLAALKLLVKETIGEGIEEHMLPPLSKLSDGDREMVLNRWRKFGRKMKLNGVQLLVGT